MAAALDRVAETLLPAAAAADGLTADRDPVDDGDGEEAAAMVVVAFGGDDVSVMLGRSDDPDDGVVVVKNDDDDDSPIIMFIVVSRCLPPVLFLLSLYCLLPSICLQQEGERGGHENDGG